MCGIFGIVSQKPPGITGDAPLLRQMASTLRHRGPDDQGFHVSPPCYMGMVRLSIVDLASGHQPMHNEDQTIWIVFNGEIYNYQHLRTTLESQGHVFYTNSDTETIVHLYEQYGHECVKLLNGMFAFAIWDKRRQELFLARDRMGVKPLYYYWDEETFAFASEAKALLQIPSINSSLDLSALHAYLHFRYVAAPKTMFRNITKLLPGYRMVVKSGSLKTEQYWDIKHRKILRKTPHEYVEEFESLFTESVKMRLRSDVPLGIFLSGGLDSSAVAAVASQFVTTPLKTFSVSFSADGELDEKQFARQVAHRYEFDHHEIQISIDDFINCLTDFVWFMDEPVADPASIPLYYLAKLASEHVKVVLSGEGSDELFAGYWERANLQGFDKVRYYQMLPSFLRKSVIEKIALKVFEKARVAGFIRKTDIPLSSLIWQTLEYRLDNGVKDLLSEDLLFSSDLGDPLGRIKDYLSMTTADNYLDQALYVDMKEWLPDDLLVKADKMTMAHSLELRVPFIDHHPLVEFAASLPNGFRLERKGWKKLQTKPLLREFMRGKLPQTIIDRPKWGFLNPALPWLRTDRCMDLIHDVLLSARARERGLFRQSYIENLISSNHVQSKQSDTLLWKLLVFELWCCRYLDHSALPTCS